MLLPVRVVTLPNGSQVGVGDSRQQRILVAPRTHGLGSLGSPGGASPGIGAHAPIQEIRDPGHSHVNANMPDIKYVKIPHGEKGTVATLKIMKKLVMGPWGARNPQVVLLANRIRDHVTSKDYRAEADAIYRYVKQHVKYKLDPSGLEWVQTPKYTLFERHAGDCDDHSTTIAALAIASGHRAAFRTVRGDPSRPNSWSHVYAAIGVTRGGQTEWFGADSTQQESTLGWDPPEGKRFGMATWVIDPNLAEEDKQWR